MVFMYRRVTVSIFHQPPTLPSICLLLRGGVLVDQLMAMGVVEVAVLVKFLLKQNCQWADMWESALALGVEYTNTIGISTTKKMRVWRVQYQHLAITLTLWPLSVVVVEVKVWKLETGIQVVRVGRMAQAQVHTGKKVVWEISLEQISLEQLVRPEVSLRITYTRVEIRTVNARPLLPLVEEVVVQGVMEQDQIWVSPGEGKVGPHPPSEMVVWVYTSQLSTPELVVVVLVQAGLIRVLRRMVVANT
jgi:hypothetical protein